MVASGAKPDGRILSINLIEIIYQLPIKSNIFDLLSIIIYYRVMKTMKQAIEEFEASNCESTYEEFENFLEGVKEDYVIEEAGSFTSPGYDMWVYSVAYIEDGKPRLYTFTEEAY